MAMALHQAVYPTWYFIHSSFKNLKVSLGKWFNYNISAYSGKRLKNVMESYGNVMPILGGGGLYNGSS